MHEMEHRKMFDNYAKNSLSGTAKSAVEGSTLSNTGYRSDYNCITFATCCHYKNSEKNMADEWAILGSVLSSSLGLENRYS
jgi:hypothetical protein